MNKAILNLNNIVYVAMWPLVTYSYYFEIVSTVTLKPGSVEVGFCLAL